MNNANLPPTKEVLKHAITELIVAEDWELSFSANAAASRAFKAEIETEYDPVRKAQLMVEKHASVIRGLGSAALSLFKRDVLAERQQFEGEFGS